jgi:hypothetical protein
MNPRRPTAPLRISLLLALVLAPVAALSVTPAPLEAQRRVSVRDAERAVRRAQLWMIDVYGSMRTFSETYRKPACDEADGSDCFQGDRECPECLWSADRRELRRLGEIYDSTAHVIARAPPQVSPQRLNWLAGQRVGLWTRLGELQRARTAVDECVAAFWWCEALRAYVEHHDGAHVIAGERFGRVLRMMPPGQACYWREITQYRDSTARSVGHDARGRALYNPRPGIGMSCAEPEEVDAFWTLADPLWSVPGNDRMTEHYARLVDMQIHLEHREVLIIGGSHTLHHHSSVLRHGWPRAFTWRRVFGAGPIGPPRMNFELDGDTILKDFEGPPRVLFPPSIMTQHYGRGQSFTVALDPTQALRAGADIFNPRSTDVMETYAPSYGPVHALPLQTGFFRRDGEDGLIVRASAPAGAAVFDAEGVFPGVPPTATSAAGPAAPADAWQLIAWDGARFRDTPVRASGDTLSAWLPTSWDAQVVSLEAVHNAGAWRARSGTLPPERGANAAMSSIVLIDASVAEPTSLEEATRAMLPTTSLPHATGAGVYWELYAEGTRNATIDVTVRSLERPGLLARIVRAGPPPELRVQWTELIEPVDGVAARTFDLDLQRLPPGAYQIELRLTLHDGDVLSAVSLVSVAGA